MLLKRHIPEVDPDSEIVVIDDVLSEGHLAMILEAVKSTSFPWYYLPNTHTYLDDERADSFGFIHSLYEPATFSAEPSNIMLCHQFFTLCWIAQTCNSKTFYALE